MGGFTKFLNGVLISHAYNTTSANISVYASACFAGTGEQQICKLFAQMKRVMWHPDYRTIQRNQRINSIIPKLIKNDDIFVG